MTSAKDSTEIFREAVRCAAVKQGFDDEKMAKISSLLVMKKPLQRPSFTRQAIDILLSIRAMNSFVLEHWKDYRDRYRLTEKDRDSIEHEVGLFAKTCRDHIDVLKNNLVEENRKRDRTWLSGLHNSVSNADANAHQHGMVLILSEQLHAVTAQFDQLRAGRFQEAINKRIPKRRRGLETLNSSSEYSHAELRNSPKQQDSFQAQSFAPQELLDQETRMLQVELTNLMDTVEETERKVLEVSALNHLFSTHVLHQAEQIEKLYYQALDATQNIDQGNKELSKAIRRSSSSRLYILLIFCVLTFTLVFLDWYQ